MYSRKFILLITSLIAFASLAEDHTSTGRRGRPSRDTLAPATTGFANPCAVTRNPIANPGTFPDGKDDTSLPPRTRDNGCADICTAEYKPVRCTGSALVDDMLMEGTAEGSNACRARGKLCEIVIKNGFKISDISQLERVFCTPLDDFSGETRLVSKDR